MVFNHPIIIFTQNVWWSWAFIITCSILFSYLILLIVCTLILAYIIALSYNVIYTWYFQNYSEKPLQTDRLIIIISGCSTGIGFESALSLSHSGFTVFCNVFQSEDAKLLMKRASELDCQDRIIPVIFDITKPDELSKSYQFVANFIQTEREKSPLIKIRFFGILSNAGYAQNGPLELLPVQLLRKQYDVNVFGAVQFIQTFLPLLRESELLYAREARLLPARIMIVTGGLITAGLGAYCSSKAALENIADVLRMELSKWNIKVITICPGFISNTNIIKHGFAQLDDIYTETRNGDRIRAIGESVYTSYVNSLETMKSSIPQKGGDTRITSDIMKFALLSKKPEFRYMAGNFKHDGHILPILLTILPKQIKSKLFGIPYSK